MRTTPFLEVWNRTVRLHGRDPRKNVDSDLRDALVDHINERVKTIWHAWRWPEWERTEERAFRTVWNDSRQFYREGVNGYPDEVYYMPNQTYYKVAGSAVTDPPVGTAPTNAIYYEVLDPIDTFIEFDQECKRSIGVMLGVWKQNPRVPTGSRNGGLPYMPSERGIDVHGGGTPTIWITYKKPTPVYTMVPYVVGKTYDRADLVFYTEVGECFQARIETDALPTDTTYWSWIPFLEKWNDYVVKGAFADSLMEFDQSGAPPSLPLVQYWNEKANDHFQAEVDTLTVQGQTLQWNFCRGNGWYSSQPWVGGEVISIASSPFASIITDEVPGGSVNTSNATYTTAFEFSTLWVYLNGLKQQRDVDYELDASTGFTMTSAPTTGDTLTVDYIRA